MRPSPHTSPTPRPTSTAIAAALSASQIRRAWRSVGGGKLMEISNLKFQIWDYEKPGHFRLLQLPASGKQFEISNFKFEIPSCAAGGQAAGSPAIVFDTQLPGAFPRNALERLDPDDVGL